MNLVSWQEDAVVSQCLEQSRGIKLKEAKQPGREHGGIKGRRGRNSVEGCGKKLETARLEIEPKRKAR